jgi:hypothetical protein
MERSMESRMEHPAKPKTSFMEFVARCARFGTSEKAEWNFTTGSVDIEPPSKDFKKVSNSTPKQMTQEPQNISAKTDTSSNEMLSFTFWKMVTGRRRWIDKNGKIFTFLNTRLCNQRE